jgi:hypothetical protein
MLSPARCSFITDCCHVWALNCRESECSFITEWCCYTTFYWLMDTGGACGVSHTDPEITRLCSVHIRRIASSIIDPPPSTFSMESLFSNPSTSALISHFASGNRPSTIFMSVSCDGTLRIEETLSQQQEATAAITVISRISSTALNADIPLHNQIIIVTLPNLSAIDSLHVFLNCITRPLLDAAATVLPSSKHMPKAQSHLSDLCSTLRLCVGSKRPEPVDFYRALVPHASLNSALASRAADSIFVLLSEGDRQVQEDMKNVLLDWTADMRRLDDICKDPSCSKLSDLEQHWLGVQTAVSSTLVTANNPNVCPSRLVDACLKQMDRDNAFRILCRVPKANFEQARQDLSTRVKAADSTIAALRDLKIEALLSSTSITALRATMVPMLKLLVERGRESSSRSSQSAEFMSLLSYDVFEHICSLLQRTNQTSLLLLSREE